MQVATQALALRENGYSVETGWVYFKETREKISVPLNEDLTNLTLNTIHDARQCAASRRIPPPLQASPKCSGCSLNSIGLPDEVSFLSGSAQEIRLLHPSRDDALPVYVQEQGARVGISNQSLQIRSKEGKTIEQVRLNDLSQLNILGNISVTTPALRELASQGKPVSFFSNGGWYYGLEGSQHKNIELRMAQFRSAAEERISLKLAKGSVSSKIKNSRTMGRFNHLELLVFSCALYPQELIRLKASLTDLIHHKEDQVIFADLGPAEGRGSRAIASLGRPQTSTARSAVIV